MESEKAMLKERLQEIALKIEENQEKYFNINSYYYYNRNDIVTVRHQYHELWSYMHMAE